MKIIKALIRLCVCLVLQFKDWLWPPAKPEGYYSLSSEPGIKLDKQPHGVKEGSYYSLVHENDRWEVVMVEESTGMVALRSVRTLVNIYVPIAALEELFNFSCAFSPVSYEQIKGEADGPPTP